MQAQYLPERLPWKLLSCAWLEGLTQHGHKTAQASLTDHFSECKCEVGDIASILMAAFSKETAQFSCLLLKTSVKAICH